MRVPPPGGGSTRTESGHELTIRALEAAALRGHPQGGALSAPILGGVHTVEIRDEDGTVLDRMHDNGEIARLVAGIVDERSFPCLRFVDPFGTTVFNAAQAGELAIEITRLADPDDDTLTRLVDLADRVAGEVHEYLWFLGE